MTNNIIDCGTCIYHDFQKTNIFFYGEEELEEICSKNHKLYQNFCMDYVIDENDYYNRLDNQCLFCVHHKILKNKDICKINRDCDSITKCPSCQLL